MLKLIQADSEEYLPQARELLMAYAVSLGFDLHFQEFEKELAEFPGEYAPLLLAMHDEQLAGCVALRKISEGVCEMKRLYVRSQFRKNGIGGNLAKAVIKEAREIGYKHMRLDTVPFMKEAIRLYGSLGFREIEPYCHNPIEGAKFMELDLS
jgi:ribosomal protein S18 acetylase RimI-like enzyme